MQKGNLRLISFLVILIFLMSIGFAYSLFHKKKSVVTNSVGVDLTPGTQVVPTGSSPRCIVLGYPKTYSLLTGDTYCYSNGDGRDCVFVAEYKNFVGDTTGINKYKFTTSIRDCSDRLSKLEATETATTGAAPVVSVKSRSVTCCRFN